MRIFFSLFVFFLAVGFHLHIFANVNESVPNVQILTSDFRSLTIAFTPQKFSIKTEQINGEELARVSFLDASYIETEGSPQIPFHVVVLGIPIGSHIEYQILESETETYSGIKLLPHAEIKKVNGWSELEFSPNEAIYSNPGPFPSKLVRIQETAFFRDQQIARIQVAGIRYFPAKKEIIKYNRVVLKINFTGGQASAQGQLSLTNSGEDFYSKAILNYEQSRPWRNVPKVQIKKRSRFFNTTLYKFTIQDEGMYKIDGRLLESHNINLNQIDPAKVRLFNNGGTELPRDLNAPKADGLIENAIKVVDGGDGSFDREDYILFYGIGVEGWRYDFNSNNFKHYINHYGFDNVYWLSLDGDQDGKRIAEITSGQPTGNVIQKYQGMAFVEEELENSLRSGLNWFGRKFGNESANKTFNLELPNAITPDSMELKIRFASKSSGNHILQVSMNGNFMGERVFQGASFTRYLRMRVSELAPFEAANILTPGTNTVQISYSHSSNFAEALLDWFELFYPARLSAVDNQLAFTVFPASGLQTYRVSNFSNDAVELFDITDFSNLKQIAGVNISNGSLTFTDFQQTTPPKRYFSAAAAEYNTVQALERIEMTDLRTPGHSAEFIIITHDDFFNEALRLESLRENGNPNNRLETDVVRITDIYNNFSGGLVDPTAIRDFLKYVYENWRSAPDFVPPQYVLLFGDGDYDFKNIINRGDKNWIPPFQTDELSTSTVLDELVTRTSDSWFTYVSGNDAVMDLAIGRINAQTTTDAANIVDKIIDYETNPFRGNWRNTITMVGDDELITGGRPSAVDNIHIDQAETIANLVIPASFDVEKIYLSEYPKVISASNSGVSKPAAQDALINQINKGTLIVNFIGHGNSTQWAHEVVFHQADNDRLQNINKPVFFVAATCDWALYDDPQRQSQPEELLLVEKRGAIAILTAARLVFSGANANFNQVFYRQLFNSTGETARLGDAFICARMLTGTSSSTIRNDEKFHIFGDPTLRLGAPRNTAVITSMMPDSIVALSTVEIRGEIQDEAGQFLNNYNGTALVNTFDSEKFVQYIPEAGFARPYFLPGNSIYRGTVPVKDGRFTARFIVPKDISYGGQRARISAYFWNSETDGAGFRENIIVSSSTSNIVDTNGPEIKLYFKEHETFTTGDAIEENVTLVAELADTLSGINIAGEIGHRITLSIDPNEETCLSQFNRFLGISSVNLTDLFRFDEGEHLRGKVEFPLQFPAEVDIGGETIQCTSFDGEQRHRLVVKVWDNSNNSSSASIEVLIVHEEGLVIREVMNYPNPFTDKTTFTFNSSQDAEVQIKVFTIAGQLIRTLKDPFVSRGFNMIDWDGRDESGDIPANGVYLYKLIARTQSSSGISQKEIIGRLAIVR